MAWKAVGGGMMTVLPALTYTLKVSTASVAGVAAAAAAALVVLLSLLCPGACRCAVCPAASAGAITQSAVQSLLNCAAHSLLQDKAENQLLGRSVARTLNLGLMFASVGHLLVFGPILNQVGEPACREG